MVRRSPDCHCPRNGENWCPPCTWAVAVQLRRDHPDTLNVSMLTRRVKGLEGDTAAVLVEATKALPRRNGGYVEG